MFLESVEQGEWENTELIQNQTFYFFAPPPSVYVCMLCILCMYVLRRVIFQKVSNFYLPRCHFVVIPPQKAEGI